jgi:hypothetical protein
LLIFGRVNGDVQEKAASLSMPRPILFMEHCLTKAMYYFVLPAGVSTRQEDHLKFLFEMNEDFCTLPSFIALCFPAFGMFSADIGLAIDPTQVS